jgi:hypothetical protein
VFAHPYFKYPDPCSTIPEVHAERSSAVRPGSPRTRARELSNLPLEDALHAQHESPKFEPAAKRWLVRYLTEGTPSLRDVAKVMSSVAQRERGLAQLERGP